MSGKELEFRALIAVAIFQSNFKLNLVLFMIIFELCRYETNSSVHS